VLRYRACNHNLAVKTGIFGQVSLAKEIGDLGALGIADGTMRILSKFCSESKPPFRQRLVRMMAKAKLDKALFSHIKRKAELLDTDAAADEQKAHKVLHRGAGSSPPQLANLKVHNLDKAHSSRRTFPARMHNSVPIHITYHNAQRTAYADPANVPSCTALLPPLAGRITSRLWRADPYLQNCAAALVFGKDAIAPCIRNSEVFSARFAANVKAHPFALLVAGCPCY
jgi:hypothetical protein